LKPYQYYRENFQKNAKKADFLLDNAEIMAYIKFKSRYCGFMTPPPGKSGWGKGLLVGGEFL
jgi:hypothetical protein